MSRVPTANPGVGPAPSLGQSLYELRAVAVCFSDVANVLRGSMQQTWTIEDLEARYHGLGRDKIIAYLATHCGYRGAPGKHALIHLDHVLQLDAVIRRDLGAAA